MSLYPAAPQKTARCRSTRRSLFKDAPGPVYVLLEIRSLEEQFFHRDASRAAVPVTPTPALANVSLRASDLAVQAPGHP